MEEDEIGCMECNSREGVRLAKDYPELANLLKGWNADRSAYYAPLCPKCAAKTASDLRGESIQVYTIYLESDNQ